MLKSCRETQITRFNLSSCTRGREERTFEWSAACVRQMLIAFGLVMWCVESTHEEAKLFKAKAFSSSLEEISKEKQSFIIGELII